MRVQDYIMLLVGGDEGVRWIEKAAKLEAWPELVAEDLQRLEKAGIVTVGQLHDWMRDLPMGTAHRSEELIRAVGKATGSRVVAGMVRVFGVNHASFLL